MTLNRTAVIQWNVQGIRNKKQELIKLIQDYNASILALQETKMPEEYLYKIPNYQILATDGHYNSGHHGGVALYLHSDIPFHRIQISSPIQVVAAVVSLQYKLTICNIYSSRNHPLNLNELLNIYRQLPQPCLIVGDFNAYHPLWGCNQSDARGRAVASFLEQTGLLVLNDGSMTRLGHSSESAIDLSLASARIAPDFEWRTLGSVLDSDHYPIIMTTNETEIPRESVRMMKSANWDVYKSSPVWRDIPSSFPTNEELLEDFYQRIDQASEEAIPRTTPSKFFPKPWWTDKLKKSRMKRENLYLIYKHSKTLRNLIAWKSARAKHKKNVKEAQNNHWKDYISNMNINAPITEIYRKMRRIKGQKPKTINILKKDGQEYCTPQEINNILSKTFARVSSTDNYSREFVTIKQNADLEAVDFRNNQEHYNRPFLLEELQYALSKTRDTATGEDNVYYSMLKNLPDEALQHFLNILNKFFTETFFPDKWNSSIIIPILKPGKEPSAPESYRPIALTSCLCKTLERMINERLMEYLIMKNVLVKEQCGGRRNRSTIDHLIRLEDAIRTAFARNEHYIAIFFDLERAYDMTWRGGILSDLYKIGMRGLLPKYIAAFLDKRFFKTKFAGAYSSRLEQENGVPQGAVLSVTLFALKINEIIRNLPNAPGFMSSLFVDDLQIGFRHQDLGVMQGILQRALDVLETWSTRNGFKFSSSKTKMVHFAVSNRQYGNLPTLKLCREVLKYEDSARFLGLIFDRKLNWRIHLNKLNSECAKILRLMKMITSQKWGADQFCLLKVFRMYMRSKMDYGAIVYASAKPNDLKILKTTCNEALRIATGAFKSSPVESLYILTDELKPETRRDYLALRYYVKLRSSLSNPAHPCITSNNDLLFRNTNQTPPYSGRIKILKEKFSLPDFYIKPEFSFILNPQAKPNYAQTSPKINRHLYQFPKASTPIAQYIQNFQELKGTVYQNYTAIYTDGSKTQNGVGAAAISQGQVKTISLPREANILSAELYAIKMANDFIPLANSSKFVIFSDSRSAIESLNTRNHHPLVKEIVHSLDILHGRGITVEYCWIPSHIGIEGNEKADQKAKAASSRAPELAPIYHEDYYHCIKTSINTFRNREWTASRQKLLEVKPSVGKWTTIPGIKREEEVILNRLRLGHTRLTHGYLMDSSAPQTPPICEYCNDSVLTVKHILIQCPNLANHRRRITPIQSRSVTLNDVLGEFVNLREVINFLSILEIKDEI